MGHKTTEPELKTVRIYAMITEKTKRNMNKIEMVQHRAARFVHNDYSRTSHVTPMIQQLGWVTLEHRRLLAQLTMFYKINQGLVGLNFPPEVSPLFRRQTSRLPNSHPFNHIQTNTNTYKYISILLIDYLFPMTQYITYRIVY